jgi:hypothetical protein
MGSGKGASLTDVRVGQLTRHFQRRAEGPVALGRAAGSFRARAHPQAANCDGGTSVWGRRGMAVEAEGG